MYVHRRSVYTYIGLSLSYRLHQVGLLNVDGYYDSLLAFIDQAVEDGFISPSARQRRI